MFAIPLGFFCAAGFGLLLIALAILWRAAKFVIIVAGTTYMLTTIALQSAQANVPEVSQIPDPVPRWADPYAIFEDDYVHRSYPYLDLLTFWELVVITSEDFIDYPHVFLSLDSCLDNGIASRHFEEDYKGFLCEIQEPKPGRVR